jgi:phage-related protein/DNA-binding XRE family transcriptional regulator
MARTDVLIYQEKDGTCPLIDWLDGLQQKAREKCIVRIERLAEKGHELRRPDSDYLRDKIYELRVALHGIQYRILYFFTENQCVITHGFIKEGNEVPPREISLAVARKAKFEENPMKHTVYS